jgi:hypothetical protein
MPEFVENLTNRVLGHMVAGCGKLLGWSTATATATAPSSMKVGVAISIIVAPIVTGVDRTLALSRVSSGYVYLEQICVALDAVHRTA